MGLFAVPARDAHQMIMSESQKNGKSFNLCKKEEANNKNKTETPPKTVIPPPGDVPKTPTTYKLSDVFRAARTPVEGEGMISRSSGLRRL